MICRSLDFEIREYLPSSIFDRSRPAAIFGLAKSFYKRYVAISFDVRHYRTSVSLSQLLSLMLSTASRFATRLSFQSSAANFQAFR
jgi:hypothetical protein